MKLKDKDTVLASQRDKNDLNRDQCVLLTCLQRLWSQDEWESDTL